MQTDYPIGEPNASSAPQGSAWAWDPMQANTFHTLVWKDYSSGTGEYSSVSATWHLDMEEKLLYLQHVSAKYPYQPPTDSFTDPAALLTDRHRRIAREVAREHFGMMKFKSRTRLYPFKG